MQDLLRLPFMHKAKAKTGQESQQAAEAAADQPAPTDDELKLRLCRLIIDRYRDKIEEYETKSVLDIKGLIQPRHEKIAELRESITEGFHPYVYEQSFLSAAKMAFAAASSFRTIAAPVSFWLSFSDIQEIGAGDEIDKSILLCSILRSLGSENAKVFVTDTRNSYALFQFEGKSFVADHSQKELSEFADGQAALSSLKGKLLYAFNDKDYEDFQDAEGAF
jgi:hypothetical protein